MKHVNRTMRIAALAMLLTALTGCASVSAPGPTASPSSAPQVSPQQESTAAPQGPQQAPQDGYLSLFVEDSEIKPGALEEDNKILLPLMETGEALGWKAKQEQREEENQTKRTVTMEKGDSKISVDWTVSDNTARGITWQKDGLLIPVDTWLTGKDDSVFVPAAFFEEAMGVKVVRESDGVRVSMPVVKETPKTDKES